ncbi:MAG: hypothetical protein GC154_03515 [bacterium]|nr:hypothetical protein [bacterium]
MEMTNGLTRRAFNASLALGCGAAMSPGLTARAAEPMEDWRREALEAALKAAERNYDPAEHMLRSHSSSVGYHTTLKAGTPIHDTRSSVTYAAALLDSGKKDDLERAQDILRKIISLQDQNPDNKTYGIWSWYLEEPLDVMSPPDWNWADFCGVQLVSCLLNHADRLGDDLREQTRGALLNAARSIKKRNVGPGYTNIAVMGTYVTMMAGQLLGDDELLQYAKKRLRAFYDATMETGSFTEYNSPTYTLVALTEITRMRMHFTDPEAVKLADELNATDWKHTAVRFHPPTGQWAGPHSRCYRTLIDDDSEIFRVLETATGLQGKFYLSRPIDLGLDRYRLDFSIPDELISYFIEFKQPRSVVETFSKRKNNNVTGSTYLHPKYNLGAVNLGDFWVQRRPLLAYWGERSAPRYLQVRFLHDGYDYCSAIPLSQQHEGNLLCHVAFATNYGDTHVSLDKVKNATIEAKDLRLRFEFGGIQNISLPKVDSTPDGPIHIEEDGVYIVITPLGGVFGGADWRWLGGQGGGQAWVDAVALNENEPRSVDFSRMKAAWLAFALQIGAKGEDKPPIKSAKCVIDDATGRITSTWALPGKTLCVSTLATPSELGRLWDTLETA